MQLQLISICSSFVFLRNVTKHVNRSADERTSREDSRRGAMSILDYEHYEDEDAGGDKIAVLVKTSGRPLLQLLIT